MYIEENGTRLLCHTLFDAKCNWCWHQKSVSYIEMCFFFTSISIFRCFTIFYKIISISLCLFDSLVGMFWSGSSNLLPFNEIITMLYFFSYRKLALKYHPQRNLEPGAEYHFKQVAEAYDILSNCKHFVIFQYFNPTSAGGGTKHPPLIKFFK